MAYKPEARALLYQALRQNWLPPLLLYPDPTEGKPVAEATAEFLDALAKTLPRPIAEDADTPGAGAAVRVGRTLFMRISEPVAGQWATSYGPIGNAWQLDSITVGFDEILPVSGMALTVTPYDATGTTDPAVGDVLVDPSFYMTGIELPYPYFVPLDNTGFHVNGPSRVYSGGQYITLWAYDAAEFHAQALLHITELVNAYQTPGPDVRIIAYNRPGPQVRPLPRPRTPTPTQPAPRTPRGFVVSGPGFSRRIPLALVNPVLAREWVVNQENGKNTPGMSPYYE